MIKTKPRIKQWLISKHAFLKWPLVILILMSACLSATAVVFAYASKQVLDAAQANNRSLFILSAIIIAGILIFQLVFRAIYQYMMVYYKSLTDKKIKAYVYQDIIGKKQVALDHYHTGHLMNHLQSDVDRLSEGMVDIMPRFVFLVLRFIFAFVLLSYLDLLFALMMLGFGLLLMSVSFFIGAEIKKRHHMMQDAEAQLRGFMQEGLEHMMLIKSFEAEAYIENALETKQTTHFKARLFKHRLSILAGTGLNAFFAAGYGFALIYGAYRIGMGVFTIGSLVAIIQLVEYMQSPFSGLSMLLPKYYAMLASGERLMMLEEMPKENKGAPLKDTSFKRVVFKNITFKYDQAIILKDFNLEIKPQTFIHIKGASGIGKTTLFKLLLGFIEPTNGHVFIEKDHSNISVSENTRTYFTYVPQGLMMMSGTIKDNLVYNQINVSMETIIKAAKTACIDEDINDLPDGYDTQIGERGFGLSEGQIQRLAIARALIKDAPILLLDEITSALDEQTEKTILENIKALTTKTCLIISHRHLDHKMIDDTVSL